jgi:hypothetical protein
VVGEKGTPPSGANRHGLVTRHLYFAALLKQVGRATTATRRLHRFVSLTELPNIQ